MSASRDGPGSELKETNKVVTSEIEIYAILPLAQSLITFKNPILQVEPTAFSTNTPSSEQACC